MSRLRLVLPALLVVLATGACRVEVVGGVDVRNDGSGTVRAAVGLDAEALQAAGDLAAQLEVADLRRTGWAVDGPRREADGLTWVRASRHVADVTQAVAALTSLNGPDGPFRDFRLRRARTLLHTRTILSGTVDLGQGLAAFADADLRSKIGDGLPLDVAALRSRFGADLDRVLQVRFEARLPGSATSNATTSNATTTDGDRLVWQPALGARAPVQARSEDLNLVPLLPIGAGLLLVVGIGGFVVSRRGRRRRPTGGRRPSSARARPPGPSRG